MSLRLFVIRHGETAWSLSGQHTGRADIGLTQNGMAEAREIEERIRAIDFSHVLVSPLKRAQQTCDLAGLGKRAKTENELAEWDNGDYEGQTGAEVLAKRPGWNLFRDGCPNGESPTQISDRVDRLIEKLTKLGGDVALFTHAHLGRVLAARWIGLAVHFAQHFLLDTASVSILCYQHDQPDQPAILLWNSSPREVAAHKLQPSLLAQCQSESTKTRQRAIERWENEGGETLVPKVSPLPAASIDGETYV